MLHKNPALLWIFSQQANTHLSEALIFKVPVGLEEHGALVTALTLFCTIGGCLWIVWGMWSTRDHEKVG